MLTTTKSSGTVRFIFRRRKTDCLCELLFALPLPQIHSEKELVIKGMYLFPRETNSFRLWNTPFQKKTQTVLTVVTRESLYIRHKLDRNRGQWIYSLLSLSRPRLSRITAYLELKIWFLF